MFIDEEDRALRRFEKAGRYIQSNSLYDINKNPIEHFTITENKYRLLLGDIQFLARRRDDGEIHDLCLAPEYPNKSIPGSTGYIYFRVVSFVQATDGFINHYLNDFDYKVIDLDEALAFLALQDQSQYTPLQKEFHDWIVRVASHEAPRKSVEEMRLAIGNPTGACADLGLMMLGSACPRT